MEDIDINNKWIFLIPVDGISNKNISNNSKEIYEDNKTKRIIVWKKILIKNF